jgi:hypothetical protein
MPIRTAAFALTALCLAASAAAEQRWIRQSPTSTSTARSFLVDSDDVMQVSFPTSGSSFGIVKGNVSFSTSDSEDVAWLRALVQKNAGAWVRVAIATPTGSVNTSERYVRLSDIRSVRRTSVSGAPALELWAEGQNYAQPTALRVIDKAEIERITKLTRTP